MKIENNLKNFTRVFNIWQIIQGAQEITLKQIVQRTDYTERFCQRAVATLAYNGLVSEDIWGKYRCRRRVTIRK
jgi:DNA-binding IclR family transcriptional regulator